MEDEQLRDDGELLTVPAEVVDMACGAKSIGYQNHKQPKAVKFFAVQFKDDEGTLCDLAVPEESYDGFDVGLCGTLTLIDGMLYGFEPDNT